MSLKATLSQYWETIQGTLFPLLEKELPPLTKKQQQLVSILEIVRIEEFLPHYIYWKGRPELSRKAIVRAFMAKIVYNMPTTVMLIERLHSDISLRRICGWESRKNIPSESVFSRAFAEFARTELPNRAHEALIKHYYKDEIIGHVITDASAIEAREKSQKKQIEEVIPKKMGRPTKGNEKPKEISRIEKQVNGMMTLEEMLLELPKACDKGAKTNSKGNLNWWIGYKLHLTTDGNGIPLAGIVTSASLHDSQVAIPLAKLTNQRVQNLYDLMDGGYYSENIIKHSKSLGHIPIIERAAKSPLEKEEKRLEKLAWKTINWKPAEMIRFESRTVVERVYSRLKDEFGASFVRVKGALKVTTHLMFGVLALTADQLFKLIT